MENLLFYVLKVNIALTVLMLCYRFLLAKDSHWQIHRIYFLFSIVFSFLWPFLAAVQTVGENAITVKLASEYGSFKEIIVTPVVVTLIPRKSLLLIAYLSITFVLIARFLIQLVSIGFFHRKSTASILEGINVQDTNVNCTPFSFFNFIYINSTLYTPDQRRQILLHEQTHATQWHSVDVILADVLCAVCWFNPAVWMMRNDIRQNLEYIADRSVLSMGVETKSYQWNLLQLSGCYTAPDIVNRFALTSLKNRIVKMNSFRSGSISLLRFGIILPMVYLFVVFAKAESHPDFRPVYDELSELSELPMFPGGEGELRGFLSRETRYPEQAQYNGLQGKVICRFLIDEEGKVLHPEVIESVSAELDAEALRVIGLMPPWEPAKVEGKPVRMLYILPISFRLE